MQFEGFRQAGYAAAGRLTADAGVDHPEAKLVGVDALLQQRDPTLFLFHPVARAYTVAEYEDDRFLRARRIAANRQKGEKQKCRPKRTRY